MVAANDSTAKPDSNISVRNDPRLVPAIEAKPVPVLPMHTDSVQMHIGWADGRMAEFNNAYTLRRHEFRLNIMGRSSYAITDRLEMSTYLPLLIMPNLSFKYRFLDTRHFAVAYELGGAFGVIPVALATGFVMPGGAMGAGTIGVFTGNDVYAKLFLSWKPVNKLTFSVRTSASRLKLSYHGIGAFAAAGGSGGGAEVMPINFKLVTTGYYMAGFETDYAINKRNGLVAKISYSRFSLGEGGILFPSLTYAHAVRKHFHYAFGIYKILDVPHYYITKEKTNNPLPFDLHYNFYWIFNNRSHKPLHN